MGKLLSDNNQFMKILKITAIFLTISAIAYAVYLLKVVVPPYQPAIIHLSASVLTLCGIVLGKKWMVLAWIGNISLFIYARFTHVFFMKLKQILEE